MLKIKKILIAVGMLAAFAAVSAITIAGIGYFFGPTYEYRQGYKQGQIDFQKGVIKYRVINDSVWTLDAKK